MATTRSINLSDEKKRDAVVALVFPEKPEEVTSKLEELISMKTTPWRDNLRIMLSTRPD